MRPVPGRRAPSWSRRAAGCNWPKARPAAPSGCWRAAPFPRRNTTSAVRRRRRREERQAQAALQSAELNLQYTRVTAPVDGRAGRALVTKGNLASADQTLLTTLVSVDPLYVYFDSNEDSAVRSGQSLEPGKTEPVRIGLVGEDGFPHQGALDFIDNRLNPNTGTLQYRAVLENPDGAFKPGQFARVEMPVAELDSALLVNRKAVLTDQDRRYVYVIDGDNKVGRRQVVTGRQVGQLLVIESGLESGDRVIVNGLQKVFGSGMQVAPRDVAMRDAFHASLETFGLV
ncbi:efflux RND transporter periplasmic adaptor subunit [Alloalcanivorax venustensis]|uniref:efflux RND transporter periplasmic adaptor subunit n=1 Tax=Alloalcanivorax venustensis TaxID=172371 RepID=UPI003C3D7958